MNGLLFGTVGTPRSTPKPGGTTLGIARLRELDLDALELAWVQSVRVGDSTCADIRRGGEDSNIALSVHAPYYINLNSQTDVLWQASRERLLAAARAGCKAGATDIIFHPGSYHEHSWAEVYPIVRSRLQEVIDTLREEGVQVRLRPETMGKSAMMGTLEETIQLSQDFDEVLPCIDFAHLHARTGNGSFNSYEEFLAALKLVAAELGPRGLSNIHVHLSGIEYGPKGEKSHLPLDEADLNYREIFQALLDLGARGRVLCESPAMEDDARLMKQTYQELLAQAQEKQEKNVA